MNLAMGMSGLEVVLKLLNVNSIYNSGPYAVIIDVPSPRGSIILLKIFYLNVQSDSGTLTSYHVSVVAVPNRSLGRCGTPLVSNPLKCHVILKCNIIQYNLTQFAKICHMYSS